MLTDIPLRLRHALWVRRRRGHEAELALLPALCGGDVAVDVGANRGLYVHHLAQSCKLVHAFEAIPQLARRLERVFPTGVRVHSVALSDRSGEAVLRIPAEGFSWATLESKNALELAKGSIETIRVATRTLDSFELEGVSFVKIDVEGHEEAVLAGAEQTFRTNRPVVLIEAEERHNPGSVARIVAWSEQLGYDGYFLDSDRLRSMREFDVAKDQSPSNFSEAGRLGRYLNNFLFLPAERAADHLARVRALGVTCDA